MREDNFREGGFGQRRSFAPVRVGDEIDVKIEAVGEKGDGIAKKQGFVLFVPGVKEGEEVRIRVTKVLRKVGFAESLGPAQGKVEADSRPPKKPAREEKEPEEKEEAAEDTEDFGEEDSSDEDDDTEEEETQ